MPEFPMIDMSVLHPEIRDLSGVAGNPAVMGAIYRLEHPDTPSSPPATRLNWLEEATKAIRGFEDKLKGATLFLATGQGGTPTSDGLGTQYELTPEAIVTKTPEGGVDSAAILGMSVGSQFITTAVSGIADATRNVPALQKTIRQG